MVTSPTFDPNDIASHDIEAAGKAYDRLASNPQHPLSNRAAREIYPPGSTFKLVTAAAALADGKTPRLPGWTRRIGSSCPAPAFTCPTPPTAAAPRSP